MVPLALALVGLVCVVLYLRKSQNYFKDRGVPFVPAWPVLGNFAEALFRVKSFNQTVLDIYNANKDAKYLGVYDFTSPAIMLRDPELIKAVSIKSFESFPDHKSFVDATVDPLLGGNLSNMTGDQWKEARSLLSPAFTSSKMKMMYKLMVECCKDFVEFIVERPAQLNKMVNTKDLFTKYTSDVIGTCAFGITVNSLKNPDNDFYMLGREATNFSGLSTSLKFFLSGAYPRIMKALRLTFVSERVGKFFKNLVRETVTARDEKGITRPDMIQLMMDGRSKTNKFIKLDMTEMTAHAFIFFFGGFDTTSTQMCIIAHELALNPDIQKRLQDEIDEVISRTDDNPTYEDISSMAYLDAVFNESLRRHTQVPFLDRVCVAPFELPPALPGGKPFTIMPGTSVWIPASAIHLDPKYYDEPEKFEPDRYLGKKMTMNDVANLGFGIGPRSCIGNRFAILETKILFFFLLAKFNIRKHEKTCSPIRYSKKTFILSAEDGWWVTLEQRNKN